MSVLPSVCLSVSQSVRPFGVFYLIISVSFHISSWNLFCSLFVSISKLAVVKCHDILTFLAGVLPLYLIVMLHTGYVILPATCNSSHSVWVSEEPLILLSVSIDIEDMHVRRIWIFINIWENYMLLSLVIFEKWEYMYIFHIRYIICLVNSSQFLNEEHPLLLNVRMEIEDVHVTRNLIFINIW
jgi:hypothetical protein